MGALRVAGTASRVCPRLGAGSVLARLPPHKAAARHLQLGDIQPVRSAGGRGAGGGEPPAGGTGGRG